MLSRQKRELFRLKGRSQQAKGDEEQWQEKQQKGIDNAGPGRNETEDSGLSGRSAEADSPTPVLPPTKINPQQSQPSTMPKPKCVLMDEQQWAQLNEQIRQICLDCSRQFGDGQNKAVANPPMEKMSQSPSANLMAKPKPILAAKQLPASPQTLRLPPNPPNPKKPSFSLPRLFLGKDKQPKRPSNQDQEQHSPTTTSAYGTGGTDTGQESPVEKQQKAGGGQPEKERLGKQKSVKFDVPAFASAQEDIQLPSGIFYTSADRLAQTLETQERLLRQELREENPKLAKSTALQRQQPVDKANRPLIKVPMSPLRPIPMTANSPFPIPSPSHGMASIRASPIPPPPVPAANLIMRNASAEMLSPTPVPKLLSRPPSYQHVVPPNSPQTQITTLPRAPAQIEQKGQPLARPFPVPFKAELPKRTRQMQLKPALDNIFAFKPPTVLTANVRELEEQPRIGMRQPRRKSKSPVKLAQPELEWVVKRRPDGSRYVTRRPVRKQKQCWSAVVKARREQSLLRERHQSGAASTTTDDDGMGGCETARNWMREQRRRHKGRGADAAGRGRHMEEYLLGDSWTAEQQSDCASQQCQILPRLNTDLRLKPSGGALQPVGYGQPQGRGSSLPGAGLFSVTTV